MAWLRLRVAASGERAEATGERLRQAGAVAVSLLPADAAEPPVIETLPNEAPLWNAVRVEGLFPVDADLAGLAGLQGETDFVAERDWSETWREGFGPMRFGRLLIVPKADGRAPGDDILVRLDPGLAFGTGTHATTALCLDWLAHARLTGRRVLDVGSGSGILAIAAARLGASQVVAVDHDPQARLASADNAHANGVELPVLDDVLHVRERFDIVLVNIVANTLCELAPTLTERAPTLVLSGILAEQTEQIVGAFPAFRFAPPRIRDGWAMLCGFRQDV